jgi:SAM-dependent methyltransferase
MNPTGRFGTRAKAYAAFRPSYPPGAIDAVLDGLGSPHELTVADIGAGTGISAHLFAERGASVIAIEPNANMRGAARPHGRVRWLDGTGERTGLEDASVDIAVACQAFHWFATGEAIAEFRRIARLRAAMLQYERDECDAFTHEYGEIVRAYATDDTEALRAAGMEVFAGFPGARVERSEHPSIQRLDRESLVGRASSSSYLPSSGPDADRMRADLCALFDRYERDGYVELVMVTYANVADWDP